MIKKVFLSLIIVAMLAFNASATVTVTIDKRTVHGDERVTHGSIAISAETYATGGFALSAASLGLNTVDHLTLTSGAYLYDYVYDYTNGKVKVYLRLGAYSSMHTASTADSFFVLDADAAASERPVVIQPVAPPFARFIGVQGALTTNAYVFARDSSTTLAMFDSVNADEVGLTGNVDGADTVYYDEDGTYRLLYSGGTCGNLGDLYVPYGGHAGKVILVHYSATAGASGVPLYWDHDQSAEDEKFTAVSPTDADGRFAASATYGTLARRVVGGEEYNNGVTLTGVTIYFIAYGR